VPSFKDFDKRSYRTVDARTGYGEWAATYEDTVPDLMDVALLERLETPRWTEVSLAADLGCGSGRTGAWLRSKGVTSIDGMDLTPEMLALADRRGVYRSLRQGDVAATGLPASAYELVAVSLVDEHLPDLRQLYTEAARIAVPGGLLVLIGYHPQCIMASGMPTHFNSRSGEPIAIETHVHLLSDHVGTALAAGWQLVEMHERLIDDEWLAIKPKWGHLRGQPVSFAFVWRKRA
jgi:SAM-dependent methyltransferase